MAIISSDIISRSPQVGGRTYVTEKHIDHTGKEFLIEYLTDATEAEQEATLLKRVEQLEVQAAERELLFYEQLVLEGIPILPMYPPKYVPVSMIYAHLFLKFCAESDPINLLKAANFTDIFSDEEFLSYGLVPEQIASIRAQASKIKDAKVLLDGYVAPLEGS